MPAVLHSGGMQPHRREVWTKWRRLIAEQDASGQSIAAFCREHDVPVSQFFAWKRRLRQASAPPFLAVQLVEAAPEPPAARAHAIEVALAGGRRLWVEPGFDPDHLRTLVAALEART
jgi:transposase-like protein